MTVLFHSQPEGNVPVKNVTHSQRVMLESKRHSQPVGNVQVKNVTHAEPQMTFYRLETILTTPNKFIQIVQIDHPANANGGNSATCGEVRRVRRRRHQQQVRAPCHDLLMLMMVMMMIYAIMHARQYGATTCHSCRVFFHRTAKAKEKKSCRLLGSCPINRFTRTQCRSR